MNLFCLALLGVSLLPGLMMPVSPLYLIGASLLGLVFLGAVAAFARRRSIRQARRALWISLVYLPVLLALLLLDGTLR